MKDDYLKYWRVVRYWAKIKYGLSFPDLEMILFLYSEDKFSKNDFSEFNELFSWKRNRFEDLRQRGHIIKWRTQQNGQKALYCLSHQTQGIVKSIYRKLSGEEAYGEARTKEFRKNANLRYTDKVYRNYIKKLNQEQRQRPSQE